MDKIFPLLRTRIQLLLRALLIIGASITVCKQHHSRLVDVT